MVQSETGFPNVCHLIMREAWLAFLCLINFSRLRFFTIRARWCLNISHYRERRVRDARSFEFSMGKSENGLGKLGGVKGSKLVFLIASLRSARHIARWPKRMNGVVWYIVSPKQKELKKFQGDQREFMKLKVKFQGICVN